MSPDEPLDHKNLHQQYFDIANVMLVVLNPKGNIEQINNHCCQVLGVKASSVVGKNWFDLFIPTTIVKQVKEVFLQLMAGDVEPVAFFDNLVTCSDGQERLIAWHNTYLTNSQGEINGVLASGEDITKKRAAEQSLQESEERFRYLAENSTDFIWEVDENSLYTYASPSVKQILGYADHELMGKTPFSLMPETIALSVSQKFSSLQEAHLPFANLENVNRHKDGHLITLESSGIPIINQQGEFKGYRGIDRDISARKQLETERNQQLKIATLSAHIGSALTQDMPLAEMMQQCCELLTHHLQAAFCRIWLINEKEEALELLASAGIYTRINGTFSHIPNNNNSKIGYIATNNTPYHSNNLLGDPQIINQQWVQTEGMKAFAGHPLFIDSHVVGVVALFSRQPISPLVTTCLASTASEMALSVKKKKTEADLINLATAITNVAEEVIVTDANAIITYVNPACEKVTGYTREELIGATPRIFQSGLHETSFYHDLWQTITNGNVWKSRIINKKKDGTLIHEDATISPIKNTDGDIIGYVSVKRDVTKQLELEENLRQAQKMEAIGTLAGGIAHDFNNFLNVIIGYSDLLLLNDPQKNKRERQSLQRINTAGSQAAELVQQILTFSRRQPKELVPLSLQPIIKENLKLLRSSLPTTIRITSKIDPDCPLILADSTSIQQVFMNLCTNAFHAMQKTGGVLDISLKSVTIEPQTPSPLPSLQPGTYVVLTVGDSGSGMSRLTMDRIFEPYYTTKTQGEGTGLGLASVHGIIQDQGGQIHVSSELGQGSCFTIYWPPIQENKNCNETDEDIKSLPTLQGHVLFVDDIEFNVMLGKELLEHLGCKVTGVTDSLKAFELMKENPDHFDAIITDQTMPDMTGVELAENILALRPDIPIIIVTGHSDLIDENKSKALGIKALLNKPIDIHLLGQHLQEHLTP